MGLIDASQRADPVAVKWAAQSLLGEALATPVPCAAYEYLDFAAQKL
jgi:hypothetical protein